MGDTTGFHLTGGLYFERLESGHIRIFWKPAEDVLVSWQTDPAGFASVMATMSARDENADTWQEALDYLEATGEEEESKDG